MPAATLSHAQSLRAIGQDLAALGVHIFNLGKMGNEYTVWAEHKELAPPPTEGKSLLKRVTQKVLEPADSTTQRPNPIHFAASDITGADNEQRLKRTSSAGTPDLIHLSVLMRVLGDYLDKKEADDFAIFWFGNSVKVVYSKKEETFTLDNLYDIGVHMYLRRSNRRPR